MRPDRSDQGPKTIWPTPAPMRKVVSDSWMPVAVVSRSAAMTDRRRITLALTSKASENLERVREEWRRTVSGADIDPDDLDAAFRVLRAIDSWIGKGASSS